MVEQEYNNLNNHIHSMAEFFETRIEYLENQFHQVLAKETTRTARKVPKKGNW